MMHSDADERYRRDPQFKSLVDMMIHQINILSFSPGEMREAATYAEISHQRMYPNTSFTVHADQLTPSVLSALYDGVIKK